MKWNIGLDLAGGRTLSYAGGLRAYDGVAANWLSALELRDPGTVGHARRVTALAMRLARKMGHRAGRLDQLRLGALLHDLGKFVIPDKILRNPGPLSDEEFALVRLHPTYGLKLLAPLTNMTAAFEVVYGHHEKWDGTGYPRGLAGDLIPWPARLVALADVWDALRSDRPYRPAWATNRARSYMQEQSGQHFDPQVVEVFMSLAA